MAEVLARRCDDSSQQVPASRIISQTSDPGTSAKFSTTSACDIVNTPSTTITRIPASTSAISTNMRSLRSPRCEAFLMTGDKMLILNSKISPHYAKMNQGQLPPSVELYEGEGNTKTYGPFDDFSSTEHTVSNRRSVTSSFLPVVYNSERCISELNHANDNQNVILKNDAEVDECTEKNYSMNTLPDSATAPYDANASCGNVDLHHKPTDSNTDQDVSMAESAERVLTVSHSATSTPLKRQSDSTIITAVEDGNSLALSANYGSNAASSTHCGVMCGGSAAKRRIRHDESPVSDVTTTISMSMPRAETIVHIATQLFTLQTGYTLADVAAFLMRKDCELSQKVSSEFMHFFNFSGKRLDVALREFLSHVLLTGETSERAYLLTHFSTRYFTCNPTLFSSIDEVHALVCALILLNTDLHGTNVSKKMTAREFVDNLLHTQYSYDRNMLKTLYTAVKETPFARITLDDSVIQAKVTVSAAPSSSTIVVADSKASILPPDILGGDFLSRHRRGMSVATAVSTVVVSPTITRMAGDAPLLRKSSKKRHCDTLSARNQQDLAMFVNPREQVDYKRGWLLKKSVYDVDGRRTPFGRRKWQMCYATLRGMALYLHKNEKIFERSPHETFTNCIRLHHAMAEVARDYKKRQHVFRLRTANFGEILLETSESTEVQRWIDAINYVAAAFSTPPLPVAISSVEAATGAPPEAVFRFPAALPVAPTTLSMTEQLRAHCERLDEVTEALAKLRALAPSIKSKGRPVYEYFYRERYLDKERQRYGIYVSVLGEKLGATSQLDLCSMASSYTANKNPIGMVNRVNYLPIVNANAHNGPINGHLNHHPVPYSPSHAMAIAATQENYPPSREMSTLSNRANNSTASYVNNTNGNATPMRAYHKNDDDTNVVISSDSRSNEFGITSSATQNGINDPESGDKMANVSSEISNKNLNVMDNNENDVKKINGKIDDLANHVEIMPNNVMNKLEKRTRPYETDHSYQSGSFFYYRQPPTLRPLNNTQKS